jgi:hypothetical protein
MAVCSIAIALGVVSALALVKGLMFRRRFRRHGPWALAACGPGFAGHGDGGCGRGDDDQGYGRWGHGWRRGVGRSFWLRTVFSRLDTTPGQEREIRSAIEELQKTAWEAKSGVKGAREDLANAIRGESFDESAFGEAQGRADTTMNQVKDAFAAALKRIHAVLDANQRERLAELLTKGPGFGRRGGTPYRD